MPNAPCRALLPCSIPTNITTPLIRYEGLSSSRKRGRGRNRSATTITTHRSAPTTSTCKSRARATRAGTALVRHPRATAGRSRAGFISGTTRQPPLSRAKRSRTGLFTATCSTRLGSLTLSRASFGTMCGQCLTTLSQHTLPTENLLAGTDGLLHPLVVSHASYRESARGH